MKIYAYSVLVLFFGIRGKKEQTMRFRILAHSVKEAESVALEMARSTGIPGELLATVNRVECAAGCHSLVVPSVN